MPKLAGLILGIFIIGSVVGFFSAQKASASVSGWQQGVSVQPRSSTDFSSESFRQSMRDLSKTGANYVSLIIPYYQSNYFTTDIQRGWNTPTDESLINGIRYIHSLGMKVMLKIHLDSYGGGWRAHINPSDRDTWYQNYGNVLLHYARLAQQEKVESLCLGTELVSMASTYASWENPARWKSMINNVRQVYSGQLTYSANWGAEHDNFINEKDFIDFWDSLDFIGMSAYYPLYSDGSLEGIKAAWREIDNRDIRPLAQKWNKPVVFTEIGYKSVNGAHIDPWDFGKETGFNEADQAKAYEALFSYWNEQSFMRGVHLWFWSSDPNYGGQGNTDYTPQHKQAQDVMAKWFGGQDSSPTPANPVSVNCQGPATNNFSGCYFSGTDFNVPVFSRTDSTMNFDWGLGSPDSRVPADNFSAHWQGNFTFNGGNYEFITTDDDGVRVYVDNNLIINQWIDQPPTTHRANIPLSAGTHLIKMEYYERGGGAVAKLSWEQAGQASQPPAQEPTSPPSNNREISVWWPTNNNHVQGVQPFKAVIYGLPLSEYTMYWQVDNDRLNIMDDSQADFPHKEAWVNLTGWNWNSDSVYRLNFVAKDSGGNTIAQTPVSIFIP